MNQSADSLAPEGEWYFSRDGQQSGPLTYDELKAKADEGALLPRKDLVWKEGMTDWRPVGEINGLFERRAPLNEVDETPYTTPEAEYEADHGEEWPGVGRGKYLFTILVLPFLLNFGAAVAAPLLESKFGGPIPGFLLLGVTILTVIITIQSTLQRFSNLGMSRWWFLGQFVPLLNIWLGHRTIACPAGYAVHKKMDGIGIFLAIIYWLFVLVTIGSIFFIAFMAYKGASDPEFQNRFQESFGPLIERFEKGVQDGMKSQQK